MTEEHSEGIGRDIQITNATTTQHTNETPIHTINPALVARKNEPRTFFQTLSDQKEHRHITDIPIPDRSLTINPDAAKLWVDQEPSSELRLVRQKIIDSIDVISFTEFNEALKSTAGHVKDAIAGEAYEVLWDYQPHSSKHWVSQLVSSELADNPPAKESFFTPGWEAKSGYPTLENMVNQGISTIVVMDDAIYSGEQIIQRVIKPVYTYTQTPEFKTNHPDTTVKIVIAAPYMTNRFLEQQIIKDATAFGLVEIVPPVKIMPTLSETFSPEEKDIIERNGGKIVSGDGEVFYQAPTTVFDHKVPDSHSFPEEIRGVFTHLPQTPYAKGDTEYYQKEEAAFDEYKRTVLKN